MINPATQSQDQLNDFTNNIRVIARNLWRVDGNYWVQLRNGTLVRPVFEAAEDEYCEDAFYAEGYRYCWNLDGTSVTSRDYDMMEIVRND